jgi:hypothetical protein
VFFNLQGVITALKQPVGQSSTRTGQAALILHASAGRLSYGCYMWACKCCLVTVCDLPALAGKQDSAWLVHVEPPSCKHRFKCGNSDDRWRRGCVGKTWHAMMRPGSTQSLPASTCSSTFNQDTPRYSQLLGCTRRTHALQLRRCQAAATVPAASPGNLRHIVCLDGGPQTLTHDLTP